MDHFRDNVTKKTFSVGIYNVDNTLENNNIGYNSILVGTGMSNSGNNVTAIGVGTMALNTGNNNDVFGSEALFYNTSGYQNSAFGSLSLGKNVTGLNNIGIGYHNEQLSFNSVLDENNIPVSQVIETIDQFFNTYSIIIRAGILSNINNSYLYLCTGDNIGGTYNSGKFVLILWGRKLNSFTNLS